MVIASGLVQKPQLVIFDEPTWGVDVGAVAETHGLIDDLAVGRLANLVMCSYLPEIMNISDRILVSRLSRVVEEFTPGKLTE